MRSKAVKYLLPITAMLSLSLSAIAACACTHHRTAMKVEESALSCHNATHETPKAETLPDESDSPKFDEHCNCFVRRAEPAIMAKSETKRSKAGKLPSVHQSRAAELIVAVRILFFDGLIEFASSNFHTLYFPRSGPSRAPPRL